LALFSLSFRRPGNRLRSFLPMNFRKRPGCLFFPLECGMHGGVVMCRDLFYSFADNGFWGSFFPNKWPWISFCKIRRLLFSPSQSVFSLPPFSGSPSFFRQQAQLNIPRLGFSFFFGPHRFFGVLPCLLFRREELFGLFFYPPCSFAPKNISL